MKKYLLFYLLVLVSTFSFAQTFTGQWKGTFIDKNTAFMSWGGDKCEYVLELETKGNEVSGSSYTYFNSNGKRYFTICKLVGFIKPGSRYVEVKEIERTKTNVPKDVDNCFQIHKLTFFKKGDVETLEGSWIPAPNQDGDCGYGTTVLTRRILKTTKPVFNAGTARIDKPKQLKVTIPKPPVAQTKPTVKVSPTKPPLPKVVNKPAVKDEIKKDSTLTVKKDKIGTKEEFPKLSFEKRDNNLIQTIEIINETFKVDFYDNGDIDGDSISVFFNGKLVESHKRLTDKALSLTLTIDPNIAVNEIVMYAENLGSIPPNTAVMIVTDGGKRYEVRIASDLKKSGVIRFVHKSQKEQ